LARIVAIIAGFVIPETVFYPAGFRDGRSAPDRLEPAVVPDPGQAMVL
jgi:hypothetical protein